LATPAKGQDMPLSDILIEGENWQLATEETKAPKDLKRQPNEPVAIEIKSGLKYKTRSVFLSSSFRPAIVKEKYGGLSYLLDFKATGLSFWPDEGTLVAAEAESRYLWAFRIDKDGNLKDGERYYALCVKPGKKTVATGGITVDSVGRVYAATEIGVQIFDPTGRLCGVLSKPTNEPVTNVAFGPKLDQLFIVCGEKVYFRKTQAKGIEVRKD
jgi:hypothetical protein